MSKTFFIDIDGTILKHAGSIIDCWTVAQTHNSIVNAQVREKLNEWFLADHLLILVTARPECMRSATIKQLEELEIPYHRLLMDMRCGPRVVINDIKPDGTLTAVSYNLQRDEGFADINE